MWCFIGHGAGELLVQAAMEAAAREDSALLQNLPPALVQMAQEMAAETTAALERAQLARAQAAETLTPTAKELGAMGRKALLDAWTGEQSIPDYYAGFAAWYQAGLTGSREAVLTYAEPSRKAPDDMTTGVYTFFGAVNTDKGTQPVKLKVKEYQIAAQVIPQNIREYPGRGLQPQTYDSVYDGKVLVLESIEKEEASSSALSTASGTDTAGKYPSASSISVKNLLALVKAMSLS